MHFIYDEAENLTVREYFEKNKDNLPDLIMVTGGYYGVTKFDDYANDQVIRFNTYSSQKRVLARDSNDAKKCKFDFLSIPVNEKRNRFRVVHGPSKVGPLDTMENILSNCKGLPLLVRFADSHLEVATVHGNVRHNVTSDYLLTKEYEENYLLGNCLLDGVIQPQITIAALSDNIQITPIKGIRGKSDEEFGMYLQEMDEFVQKVKFDREAGNPAITKIQFDSSETGTGASIDKNNPLISLEETMPGLEKAPPPVPRRKGDTSPEPDNDGNYCVISPEFKLPSPKLIKPSSQDAKDAPPSLPPRPIDLDRQHSKNSADASQVNGATSNQPNAPYVNDVKRCIVSPTTVPKSSTDEIPKSNIENLSIKDVGKTLKKLKLDKYVNQFKDDMIDGTLLKELNEEILEQDYKFRKIEAIRLIKYVETGHIPS